MAKHQVDLSRVLRAPISRDELHALVDALPDLQLGEAGRYLAGLSVDDPVLRSLLLAPLEDEELSDEEQVAIAEGLEAYGRGEVVTDEELARELGECP